MTTRSFGKCAVPVFVLATAVPAILAAQSADTLRGRVTTDSGVVIAGAEVIATRAPDRAFKTALTDAAGVYQIVFEQGTGDYLLHVSALGRETVRYRIKRAGTETTLTHDFQLKSSVQKLETVTVEAKPDKPERDFAFPVSQPGEASRSVDGVTSAIPPDVQGNIAAGAATVPGVTLTPNGVSVLGLDPSQNSTTLNGLSFGGADIPRNARTYTRVTASSYDPSHGWFSGAQLDVNLDEGSIFVHRPASLTLDAPALQYTDPTSKALGERYSNVVAGLGSSGSLHQDRIDYNLAVDVSHRASDFASLERSSPDLLEQSGVAKDSVARLLGILSVAGIQSPGRSLSDNRTSDNVTFIGRIDHSQYNFVARTEEKTTWGLLGYAKLGRSSLLGVGPMSTALHGGDENHQVFGAQALYSTFLHDRDYLTEAKTSLSLKRDRAAPYLDLPEGRVLVSSDFSDGPGATSLLAFGGNGSLPPDSRDWTWETNSVTRFYASQRTHHRVQLTADSRVDGFSRGTALNDNGTFTFNSLADIAANAPSSFTRTLNAPTSSAAEWNAFASLGDYWRVTPTFQVLAGARLEGNHFLDKPRYNPRVEQIFGVRTDQAPAGFHASPRLGFTWIRKPSGDGFRFSPIGIFNFGNLSYLRGGIGEFRSLLPATALSQAMIANGLPGGATYLTCIGDAVPTPDWAGYALDAGAIPRQCLAGSGIPMTFTDTAPTVNLFAKSYQPPRSWRANLSYASDFGPLIYSVEGIYSLNLNQPGRSDLNFNDTQQFLTTAEGRPVFVGVNSIVPATGLVSSVDARKSTLFGSVVSNRSDLRSVSRQLTVNLSPSFDFASSWYLSLAYTLSSVRALASGFDAPTFGSPLERQWARGDLDSRHRFQLSAGKTVKRVTFTMFGTFQSGFPFTPLVGGDVNGDGMFNDRAFVFSSGAGDSAVGAGLRALMDGSSSRTRDCLARQLGRPAGRNSCEGPWSASLNANLRTSFEIPHSYGRYVDISLAFSNPLGGLDQLLHGSQHLHGWGLAAFPDPVLYNVRGFDSASREFRYEVNPRFGSTNPAATTIRSPFRITLDFSINTIGPTTAFQQVERMVSAGRAGHPGRRLSADDMKKRYARGVPDAYAWILEENDSLLLTPDQQKALEAAHADYLRGIDSVWAQLVDYLAGLGDSFDVKAAVQRQETVTDAAWEFARLHVQKTLGGILSPIQLQLLGWPAGTLYRATKPLNIRIFGG